MDPKPRHAFSAPGHASPLALRLPGVHQAPFLDPDDHIVRPETREEMVRGKLIIAQPAHPPHADRHARLDQIALTHVKPGYIVSSDLLTRFGPTSNFATDVCVRKDGEDPKTGGRHLEELAFEIVSKQSLRHITIRAEDMFARGLRRLIVIFVKRGEVTEWSPTEHRFVPLPLDGVLEDPTLAQPIPIRAMLDAAAAKHAVRVAMWEQDDPWLLERKQELRTRAQHAALLLVLEGRGLPPSDEQRAAIESCTDPERLQHWLRAAGRVNTVAELLDS